MRIGAQFYTIRDYCKTPEDFAESLKKVADIGYKTVQISGTCEYEPLWLKAELEKNGLACVVTHTPVDKMIENPDLVAENHSAFDCKYIGIGYYEFGTDERERLYGEFVEKISPVARAMKENGKYLMYHNHDKEFQKIDRRLILDKLAEDFPADELGFILDTYWVQRGGADPAQVIEGLKGRVPCIHLKDYAYDAKMAVIGEGNINFSRVFSAAQNAGTEFMLVEQDDCSGENPFECLRRSYEYLRANGFE